MHPLGEPQPVVLLVQQPPVHLLGHLDEADDAVQLDEGQLRGARRPDQVRRHPPEVLGELDHDRDHAGLHERGGVALGVEARGGPAHPGGQQQLATAEQPGHVDLLGDVHPPHGDVEPVLPRADPRTTAARTGRARTSATVSTRGAYDGPSAVGSSSPTFRRWPHRVPRTRVGGSAGRPSCRRRREADRGAEEDRT